MSPLHIPINRFEEKDIEFRRERPRAVGKKQVFTNKRDSVKVELKDCSGKKYSMRIGGVVFNKYWRQSGFEIEEGTEENKRAHLGYVLSNLGEAVRGTTLNGQREICSEALRIRISKCGEHTYEVRSCDVLGTELPTMRFAELRKFSARDSAFEHEKWYGRSLVEGRE